MARAEATTVRREFFARSPRSDGEAVAVARSPDTVYHKRKPARPNRLTQWESPHRLY